MIIYTYISSDHALLSIQIKHYNKKCVIKHPTTLRLFESLDPLEPVGLAGPLGRVYAWPSFEPVDPLTLDPMGLVGLLGFV